MLWVPFAHTFPGRLNNGTTETTIRTINDFNGAVTDTFLIFELKGAFTI